MKKAAGLIAFFVFSLLSNFLLFTVSYNKLATPFLHESQRVENADVIMKMILPGYALISTISVLLCFFLSRKKA
jgi:ABC-type antimicrobial peptide transport system permease subunit